MTDQTVGIIYAIKRSGKVWDQAVKEYMASYSGSPIEVYTETELNRILKLAFVDYIETCDKPHIEIYSLLTLIESNGTHSLGYYLANVLGLVQVKDNGKFVNGFKDI